MREAARMAAPLLLCLLCTPALSQEGQGEQPRPLRVLVVVGGHDFEREPFEAMFESFESLDFTIAEQPEASERYRPEMTEDFDAAVLYDMVQDITEERKRGLLDLIEAGTGVVVLHHALASYDAWTDWHMIVGGHYYLAPAVVDGEERPAGSYRHDVDIAVTIADTEHPITAGVEDFTLNDEVYGGMWISPNAHVLLTTDNPESTREIAWTTTHGEGRIATIQLGHGPSAYGNPSFRRLLEQAIGWVAKGL